RDRRAHARVPPGRAPPAQDRQVVRHRAARGEVYLAAIRADHGGQPLARLLQPHAGLPAPRVLARRIPGHLLQRGAQRLQHLRSYRRRGRVVEVDPVHFRLHTQFLASHPTPERRGGPGLIRPPAPPRGLGLGAWGLGGPPAPTPSAPRPTPPALPPPPIPPQPPRLDLPGPAGSRAS